MNVYNQRALYSLFFIILTALVTSCGGGGGGGGGTPTPTPQPSTSSATSASSQASEAPTYQQGGAIQGHTLKFPSQVSTFAGTNPATDGVANQAKFHWPAGLVVSGGKLYVADSLNNKIRTVDISTGEVSTFAGDGEWNSTEGIGILASFAVPNAITAIGGNLYVADLGNKKIRQIEISTGIVSTLAGSGSNESKDGAGLEAGFSDPRDITTDGVDLYVLESSKNIIRKIEVATRQVITIAGNGTQGNIDGPGKMASFNYPTGLACDGKNLYIADSRNRNIRKIVLATGLVSTFSGSGKLVSTGEDGPATTASFFSPSRLAISGQFLYLTDGRIRKIALSSGEVTTLAGTGQYDMFGADGFGTSAGFADAQGIASDGTNLFISDTGNDKIRKIILSNKQVTTLAGSGRFDGTDGIGKTASFNNPIGVTSDGTNLYVTDSSNHKIRGINIATGNVTTIAGSGNTSTTDGIGVLASFFFPAGITTDGKSIFVTETGSHTIRMVALSTGQVTTLAGSETGEIGHADGIGKNARFYNPSAITTDGTHLYVADTSNNKIRKIVLSTLEVTTIAGSGLSGSDDGIGISASFSEPSGITTDGTNLYVADSGNNRIRQIVISTQEVTTIAGSGVFGSIDSIGSESSFYHPTGITYDGQTLYVTETSKVRSINLKNKWVSTVAGGKKNGNVDGSALSSLFHGPSGITTDGRSLFVVDQQNWTIRKIE